MLGGFDPVVLGGQRRRPHINFGQGGFASGVAVAVVQSEQQGQPPRQVRFAAQEDALPGNEDMVEDGDRMADAKCFVRAVKVRSPGGGSPR